MQDAKDELERRALMGENVTLADVLISRGLITDHQRKNLEETAKESTQETGALGHYTLIRKLGQGGMGAVWLAEDNADKSKVAVKILPEKFAKNPELLARFRRETKAAFRLRHENIAAAYGEGEQNGVFYYTMEYCDGERSTLFRNAAADCSSASRLNPDPGRARTEIAHENGIIHRDIKPRTSS